MINCEGPREKGYEEYMYEEREHWRRTWLVANEGRQCVLAALGWASYIRHLGQTKRCEMAGKPAEHGQILLVGVAGDWLIAYRGATRDQSRTATGP